MKNYTFAALLVLIGGAMPAFAQDDETADPSADPAAIQDENQGDAVDGEADGPLDDWDRLIYVPFKELGKVFDNDESSVVIPYRQYAAMLKEILRRQAEVAADVDIAITKATYEASIDKDLVRINATLSVKVLADEKWVRRNLEFGDVSVGNVTSDNDDMLFRGVGHGAYELLLKGEGDHSVTLELLATVRRSPDGKSFGLKVPTVGISELTIAIPEADQDVEVTPGQIVRPAQNGEDSTTLTASLGATNSLNVRWNPRAGSKPIMDLLATATNNARVTIEPGLLQTTNQFTLNVLRGELTEVDFDAPADARVLDVTSNGGKLRSWTTEPSDDGKSQRIHAELLSAATGAVEVTIQTERSLTDEVAQLLGRSDDGSVLGVHAVGVLREEGQVTVVTDPTLTTVVEQQSGLTRIAGQTTAKAAGDGGGSQVWRFTGANSRLVVRIRPVEPRLLAQQTTHLIFRNDELNLRSTIQYTVERTGVFSLQMQIPEGLTIDSVSAEGMREFNTDQESGVLTVSLAKKEQANITVNIVGHQDFDANAERSEVTLPTITPLNVERETGRVDVFAPSSLEVVTDEDKLTGAFPAATLTHYEVNRARLVSAWEYTRRPFTIAVVTTPRPTQIAANIGTTAEIDPDIVHITGLVRFDIRNAGIDTLRLAVPEDVADQVRFNVRSPSTVSIRQQSRADTAVDGFVTWTLVLQDDFTGQLDLEVMWEETLEDEGTTDSAGDAVTADDAATDADATTDVAATDPDADAGNADAAGQDDAAAADTGDDTDTRSEETESNDDALPAGARRLVIHPVRVLPPYDEEEAAKRRITMTQTRGEIRLLRDDSLSIAASAGDGVLEAIDVRELELLDKDGYLAFRYYAQPVSARVQITKHEIHEVVATVVSRSAIEIVTEKQPTASYRWRLRVTSSERQRLRVDLPALAELQAPLINGRRTTIELIENSDAESGWDAFYVNVSRPEESDQAFLLTFLFRAPITDENTLPFEGRGGKQVLRMPRVDGDDSGAIVVQQVRTAIWVPRGIALVGQPEQWTLEETSFWSGLMPWRINRRDADLDRWISDSGGSGDFAREGTAYVYRGIGSISQMELTWWDQPFVVIVLTIALALIALILRNTSWGNKLTILLLLALTALAFSLRDSESVVQLTSAATFGLIAVVGVWVIHGLLGVSPKGDAERESPPPPPPTKESSNPSPGSGGTPPSKTPGSGEPKSGPPPGTVEPSPEVAEDINRLMGGK